MLGSCYPVAQAALAAVARPFRYVVHHVPLRGIGHHAHNAAAQPGLAGAASSHAGTMPLMCAQAPGGLLPAGPIPGAYGPAYASGVGSVGNAAATGSAIDGGIGSAAAGGGASGGGLLGGGSLVGSVGALTSAALLASGLALAALPAATAASDQLAAQPGALADMMQPLPFIAAPSMPPPAATASAMMPASNGAPDMTPDTIIPDAATPDAATPDAATPGAATPGVAAIADAAPGATGAFEAAASNVPTSVPEPASLALLGIGAAATWASRRRPGRRR